ncbi:hypothetical protein MUP95_06590, partial [bacterium]|nr:hypothetical protein [bacterium]
VNTFTIGEKNISSVPSEAVVGESRVTSSENTGRHLQWMTDQRDKKITVATRGIYQGSKLQVQAVQCVGGEIVGEASIAEFDRDFITSISALNGSCGLNYSVLDQRAFDNGQGYHDVVYTITDVF